MLLSIIVPTFNRLWSLPDALASCPRRADVEIIVVDDGSSDGTAEWLHEQIGLVVLHQDNWGKPAAVNAGFAIARGKYVKFLDSDDVLNGASTLSQVEDMDRSASDISVAGYIERHKDGGSERHDWVDSGDFIAQQLGECDSSHYSAYVFRRGFVDTIRHRPDFSFRDDRMFILECALADPVVTVWPEPTLEHHHHARHRIQFQPGSILVTTNWQELIMFKKIIAILEKQGRLTDRRKAAVINNVWPLTMRIAAYDRREGRAALAWIHTLSPGFVPPAGGVSGVYRRLGYSWAQTIAFTARAGRNALRSVWRWFGASEPGMGV